MGEDSAFAHPTTSKIDTAGYGGIHMPELQHRHLPKYNFGAHFLTAKTHNNIPYFRMPACADIFCEELETARIRYRFHVLAFVVMPDHVHLLLWWDTDWLPELTISKIAWAVKGLSAKRIVAYLKESPLRVDEGSALVYPDTLQPTREPRNKLHRRNWRYQIWQQGAGYDFNVYTERKLLEKIAYIHANPVRTGLADTPEDYRWSSGRIYAGRRALHSVSITPYTEVLS